MLAGRATWFSHEAHEVGSPPDWFLDPASGQRFPDGRQHWSRCKPFAAADIKRCWELSRWGWAPLLARAWRFSGDSRYLEALNAWSRSWCQANPVNGGSNWLCGQEASMRLLHALQAWQLCDAPGLLPNPTPERAAFAAAHLQRIAATERYAQAQDNNHWTSEAAALFIGGSWLAASASPHAPAARHWAKAGRRALERSVGRLVMPDGSFAQHSLTYHRLLLDTLAQVELWRRWLDLEPFSERFFQSLPRRRYRWLAAMVDPLSGDGPNLGSNDGAFCYGLHGQPYRDFRPTLQLASVLFQGHSALPSGPWDEPLHWLGLVGMACRLKPSSHISCADHPLRRWWLRRAASSIGSWALFRLPTYRFRPAHADPLHFDLWHQGINLLRDGGSYAYNASPEDLAVFPGIASHNTVQFDGAEPMPRLGRFLWGDWLQLEAPASVRDKLHHRCLPLPLWSPSASGASRCLRPPLDDHRHLFRFPEPSTPALASVPRGVAIGRNFLLIGPLATLQIHCDQPITRLELVAWLGINALRHQNAAAGAGSDCCSGSVAILTTSIQLSFLIFPARESSLLPPVFLHPCWFCRHPLLRIGKGTWWNGPSGSRWFASRLIVPHRPA